MEPSSATVPRAPLATRRSWLFWPAAVVLLALHAALALTAATRQGPTFDEPAHLVSGVMQRQGDRRLVPEAGVLPLRWAALGARDEDFPEVITSAPLRDARAYVLARDLLFSAGAQGLDIVQRARRFMIVFPLLCGALVALWARALHGDAGGLTALVLWVACPTVLGHGPLVTMDAASALFLTLSAAALWRVTDRPRVLDVALAGVAIGALLLTKLTWVLVPPLAIAFVAVRALARRMPARDVLRRAGALAAAAAIAWVVLWAGYGFRFEAAEDAEARGLQDAAPWGEVLARCGTAGPVIQLAHDAHLAPQPWLLGNAFTLQSLKGRASFVEGRWSTHGWWWFFPWLFLLKTPLPALAIVALAAVAGTLQWPRRARFAESWALPAAAVVVLHLAACVASSANIGYRHLMPALPALFVLCGVAGRWLARTIPGTAVLVVLLALDATSAARAWPDYIASFNELAGGRDGGWRHAVDSSCDWGQSLPALRDWLAVRDAAAQGAPPACLAYFGSILPQQLGISARALPSRAEVRVASLDVAPLRPGTYVFSATLLQRVHARFPGPWTPDLEERWQKMRASPPMPHGPGDAARDEWVDAADAYTDLRCGRLASYLRDVPPDAVIGGSLLVFELDDRELRVALDGPPP